ncbi:hypothetical protein KAR91_28150 [Candidatus Pacearchaeota archaeon]|nr:hypothetical protein [Candidatus Pacearchaeota archaeon]
MKLISIIVIVFISIFGFYVSYFGSGFSFKSHKEKAVIPMDKQLCPDSFIRIVSVCVDNGWGRTEECIKKVGSVDCDHIIDLMMTTPEWLYKKED